MSPEITRTEYATPVEQTQEAAVLHAEQTMFDKLRDSRLVAPIATLAAIGALSLGLAKNAEANTGEIARAKAKQVVYDAYGASLNTPPTIVQKRTTNDPITATYKFPFGYAVGVPTPALVELKYDAKTKFKYSGIKESKAPTFSKVYRKNPIKLKNMYLTEFYTTGNMDEDTARLHNATTPAQEKNSFKDIKLYPNKTKKINTVVTIDQCNPWPTPTTDFERQYLVRATGFESQPAGDSPCLPVKLAFHYDGSISARGYKPKGTNRSVKWQHEMPGDLQINRVKVSPSSQ